MNENDARRLGRRKAIRALATILFLYEGLQLIMETRGDFANGILFFIERQLNIFMLLFFCLLFGMAYYFGARTGVDILIKQRKMLWVIGAYPVIQTAIAMGYFTLLALLLQKWEAFKPDALGLTLQILLVMFLVWVWTAFRLRYHRPRGTNHSS